MKPVQEVDILVVSGHDEKGGGVGGFKRASEQATPQRVFLSCCYPYLSYVSQITVVMIGINIIIINIIIKHGGDRGWGTEQMSVGVGVLLN